MNRVAAMQNVLSPTYINTVVQQQLLTLADGFTKMRLISGFLRLPRVPKIMIQEIYNIEKQMVPRKSTAEEVSFE